MSRSFEIKPAVRESVPLLIGIMGPSGGGKTFSALRLASGIQKVRGGDIYGIDTEARRMLHYADRFKFKHVQFDAPFASLDYLAAIQQCVKAGAGVIIVDSLSHEHEGPGGMIDFQDHELQRLAGDDYQKRERMKMLAWQKPKAARRSLINGILQLNANFVFCFRAKNTVKPVKGANGKTEIVPQGFMPIAGEELVFEMTMNCLLLPHANGVPTWRSDQVGERLMMKLPEQFREYFEQEQPLSEDTGAYLAEWATGGKAVAPAFPNRDALFLSARGAATGGKDALQAHWRKLNKADRAIVNDILDELKRVAAAADQTPEAIYDENAVTPQQGNVRPTPSTGGAAASSTGATTQTTGADEVTRPEPPTDGDVTGVGGQSVGMTADAREATAAAPTPAPKETAATPAQEAGAAQPVDAAPVPLTSDERTQLLAYSARLEGSMSASGLQRRTAEFFSGEIPDEATTIGRMVQQIYNWHGERCKQNKDYGAAQIQNMVRALVS